MWTRDFIACWILRLAVCTFLMQPAAGRNIYVDADAAGVNNGSSWSDAYNCFQEALAAATSGDEIRVAEGIYKPDQYVVFARLGRQIVGSSDRTATFQLVNGVTLKGGYAGLGQPDPNARDTDAYQTVLTGDLNGDDLQVGDLRYLLTEPTRAENSYTVVTATGANETAILDGFTITGGNANALEDDEAFLCGAGVYMNGGSPTFIGCAFTRNGAAYRGGGICSNLASPAIIDCAFEGNQAKSGGAIEAFEGSPMLINCTFAGNSADTVGGGVCYLNNYTTIINCTFSGNSAQEYGGGLYAHQSTTLYNCTFSSNGAEREGGGIYNDGHLTLVNCILWGNIDSIGSDESAQVYGGTPVVNHCCIQGWTGTLGGTGNHGAYPLFVDADGADNVVGTQDDNLRLLRGSPCIDTGDNPALPPTALTDLDGDPRVMDGTVDMGAYEGPHQGFLLSAKSVQIPEGQRATFTVALAMDPEDAVAVTVAIESGDPDITIKSSQVLTFDSSDYWRPQTVTLSAAKDLDCLHGSAMVLVRAPGLPAVHVTANELDKDPTRVLYVDDTAAGANDGMSWDNAFTDLQQALNVAAATPAVKEVHVAQGIYTPARPFGDREATFQLINRVAIRGGYAGPSEIDPDARDIDAYQTVLSGDLNGDDVYVDDPRDFWTEPSRVENSYHVVAGSETDATAVLDGFTITGGNAEGSWPDSFGGGMLNTWGHPTIFNCTFAYNSAQGGGGGVFNKYSSPTLTKCVFRKNLSYLGGGVSLNNDSQPTLIECTFIRNCAESRGGGVSIASTSCNPTLINGTFIGNWAEMGGALDSGANLRLTNCVLTGNSASLGAGIHIYDHDLDLTDCTFVGNSADYGSALACAGGWFRTPAGDPVPSHIRLINCIVWDGKDQIYTYDEPVIYSIAFSNVHGGWLGEGNIYVEPDFVDADGPDNLFGTEDDNPRLRAGSPCIDAGNNEADADASAAGGQLLPGVDADLNVRRFDDPATIDTGAGRSPIIDMGAYEFASPPIPSVLYVNDDAGGANTGTSWEDAFTDLQTALLTAFTAAGKVKQIWVAAGRYTPAPPGGDRSATLHLINGLAIYGGFAGIEDTLDQRNPIANVTVLSGDLNGNDGPDFANNDENSYHVVTGNYTDPTAILDGFTITAGNANFSDPLLSDTPDDRGAGLYIVSGSPDICDCVFIRNAAAMGGGVYFDRSSPALADCTITENTAANRGGGIYCHLSAPALDDCTITENSATERGGGIYCHESAPKVTRCTITANSANYGGGIYCEYGDPSFVECTFTGNWAKYRGGGLLGGSSGIVLSDCTFRDNRPDGAYVLRGTTDILGVVQVASNNLVGSDIVLTGDGTLRMTSDVTLDLDDSTIRCNVSGPGTIQVGVDSELIVEADAVIDLGYETGLTGRIICDGLLRLRQNSTLMSGEVYVSRASFEDNAIIANCVINSEAGAPYGQFFIEDNVHIWLDRIEADGDRYLDLNPSEFDCNNIHVGAIDVNITEGVGGSYGGLFELRGLGLEVPPCGPNEFLCQVDSVPDFDPNTWTIERIELVEGAKLNLTNRFDFQAPYDSGGDEEVLYVKHLILGANSVLNTAFNRLYYETLTIDPTAQVINVPLLGFSLNNIAFDDENEFLTRIRHNNFEHPANPTYNRTHVERVVGLEPDPNGVVHMCNLLDLDPESSSYQRVINARAKGLFAKSSEEEILIQFEYLFCTSDPDVELVVYLTNAPELLAHSDPERDFHYLEVARLQAPPVGRPGSAGSGRFGVFQEYVWRGKLDFIRGTRIEFELIGPAGTCVLINNWDPQVSCYGICMDINWDNFVNVIDFLTIIGEYGTTAELLPDGTNSRDCLDGVFSTDGYVDSYDLLSWDWAMSGEDRLLNFCGLPLSSLTATATSIAASNLARSAGQLPLGNLPTNLSDLLIAGKRGGNDAAGKLQDRLYMFDGDGQCEGWSTPASDRCNIRLVQGTEGELCQINSETGVLRLDELSEVIVPPGRIELTNMNEPRYNTSANVYVGIQGEGPDSFGRPILDVVFEAGYVYVVPVVVHPDGTEPYVAAAKLQLLAQGDPPYELIQLYDDPPPPGDNQCLDNLREIEIGRNGNLYAVNTGSLNESDILWVYDTDDGTVKRRLELGNPGSDCYLPGPVAMHVSNTTDMLYLASSQNDPDGGSVSLYAFSASDLGFVGTIEIVGMGHITDITEDPVTGTLWVVGFNMADIPQFPNPSQPPFYHPCLAEVPSGSPNAQAQSLGGVHDLGLPLSIVWTGAEKERVNFTNLAIFASYWLASGCASDDWCQGADLTSDGNVTFDDLRIFCESWLHEVFSVGLPLEP